MTPEASARLVIDEKLKAAGWLIQSMDSLNLHAGLGVAVREFQTSTGPVDYALFVDGRPVGVVEAKPTNAGNTVAANDDQASRYAHSTFRWVSGLYRVRFLYETTDQLTYFTDLNDIAYRTRNVFSFHQPQTLQLLLQQPDTVRNNLKHMPPFDPTGFRTCQIDALKNLDASFAANRPKALVQMATGAGKTFTAITAAYRLLKHAKMNRILFLVDTRNLGTQAEQEFQAYRPNDDNRAFPDLYGVYRLKSSAMPGNNQVYISTIQRMYSILKGEPLSEDDEDEAGKDARSKLVVYNAKYPPEFFDCIIVDECHRSIYNVWSQVLEYFDAFIIGLTATPDNRTYAYFDENIVSEYSREKAIADLVNVGEDVFTIKTEIGENGAHLMQQVIDRRNRLSRVRRREMMEADLDYRPNDLDRAVVNPSQIRTVIRAFKAALPTVLYPHRREVPKTLIFAKNEAHATDIVEIVREVFGEGNEFCKKITYTADDRDLLVNQFRNSFYPRIAVTVDMIATGTDIKPLECLIFMRDVRSENYYEQMKGRGTRVLSKDDLQKVTPSATSAKDHFVIVDAVGVTHSQKTVTRTLERKPSESLRDLMLSVALGNREEDTLTSLANRLIRLGNQLTPGEHREFAQVVGMPITQLAGQLLDAFDEDVIVAQTGELTPNQAQMDAAREQLIDAAVEPFNQPEVRSHIETVKRKHDQIIDNVNLDRLLYAGFDADLKVNADTVLQTFRAFIEENRDEIIALRIVYDQRYADRPMAIRQLQALYEKLMQRHVTAERLWDCYAIKQPDKVKKGVLAQLTDLIAMIRFELGLTDRLTPFADRVGHNFQQWTLRRNAGNVHFTEEQMVWLRKIRDQIAVSLSITEEDLDLNPFDRMGGLGRFYELFGEEYLDLMNELNVELVG